MRKLLDLAEKMVEYGKKKGATQMQATISEGTEFNVEVRNQNIEKLTEAGSISASFKVIVDEKVATASSSDLKEETLHKLIDNAVTRAKLTSPDEFSALPDKEAINVNINDLDLFDQKILDLSPQQKIDYAKKIEEIGKSDERISLSAGSFFGSGEGSKNIANSNGFSGSYKNTIYSCGVFLQSGEGDDLFQDGWYEYGRSLTTLPKEEELAKKAIERTTRLIGSRKIDTQKVPVVFDPQMTGSLLGFLSQCVSGSSIYMKRSFLVDKLNTKIANSNVNIYDDGLLPGAPGTRPFDSEGVPTRKTSVIENGELKNYLLSTYSARKLNLKSTGNASGTTNFYLAEGEHTPEEIIKSVKKGLYLVKTMGQGTDPTTGALSKGAFGLWIEDGKLTYPVDQITISGNLGEMLMNMEMVGNDLAHNRSTCGPTVKISGMTISGK
jgi:PmbA protein